MSGYYDLPLLKPPVWTWEVPAYFFAGGAAGAAAVIGAVARATGAPQTLVRDARWMAAVGGAASPALLISDLGRPERFLNMLRVFKLQSPMSVGAWTLVAFSSTAAASALADAVQQRTNALLPIRQVTDAAGLLSAATGLVLSTYPGVLLGATAIPVWSRDVKLLPLQSGASSLGAAASLLELAGHRHRALHYIALGAAAVDSIAAARVARTSFGTQPGESTGTQLVRAGTVLAGPVPLALRLLGGRSRSVRQVAAVTAIAGSLLTRIGWVHAGRSSALSTRSE
ncbi:MAG: NrfD/PsrC family molybdoenzyme membrane anchor subunit [Vicinamibacterales bacterium]